MTSIGIFIFRRDLRKEDNLGLTDLLKRCDLVLPVFIFDKQQITKNDKNKNYFSENAATFICQSVIDLKNSLPQLKVYFGDPIKIIKDLVSILRKKSTGAEIYIGFNKDYSPYAIQRDAEILKLVDKHIINEHDLFLHPIESAPYKQFHAFYNHASQLTPRRPIRNGNNNYYSDNLKYDEFNDFGKFLYNESIAQYGGRTATLARLKNLKKKYSDYNLKRNFLDYETTNISGALNIGCVSSREIYYKFISALGAKNDLIKQLYWRDFYLYAYINIPTAQSFTKYIDSRFDKIKWRNNEREWKTLIDCKTGFLLVDAAMSQLKTSGYIHNRARLILGYFWTKYLRINMLHPVYGSFVGYSQYLLDAIGATQNKMNHHWILDFDSSGRRFGKGISGRPLKIDNSQIKKYDPECAYIKKWLPHLSKYNVSELVKWSGNDDHPKPMFDPVDRYNEWVDLTKNL